MAQQTLAEFTNLKYLGLILFQLAKRHGNVKTVEATEFWFLAADRNKRGLYRFSTAPNKSDKTLDYIDKGLSGHSFWAERIDVLGKEPSAISPPDTSTIVGPDELAGPSNGMEAYLNAFFIRPQTFNLIFSVNPRENATTSSGSKFFYTLAVPFAPYKTLKTSELQPTAGYGTLVLMTSVESEIKSIIARIERFLRLKAA